MTTTDLCDCGKPADHVNADPDVDEGTWACLVPNFDPATGVRLPPVGKYAPVVTSSAASGVTRADGEGQVRTHARLSDDTVWPLPQHEDDERGSLSWRLTYGQPSRSDLLLAASIIGSYGYLLTVPRARRDQVVRDLRAAMNPEDGAR